MTLSKKILTAAVAAFALGTASLALSTDASARGWFGVRSFHGGPFVHHAHFGHHWYRGFGVRHYVWPRYTYGYGFARFGCWRLTAVGRVNICNIP